VGMRGTMLRRRKGRSSVSSSDLRCLQSLRRYSISYPTYRGAQYDASTTNLTYSLPAPGNLSSADHLNITLSFLSPITPTSTLRQSLPAAYITVYVEGGFDVNIYIDVNGQWVSGFPDSQIEWRLSEQKAAGTAKGLKTWRVKRKDQIVFAEEKDQAEWGQLSFTAPDDVQHESGPSEKLRQRFARTGTLRDKIDPGFPRAINKHEPVFAFSKSFELTKSDGPGSDSVLFTISHIQDEVTQFASERGLTRMLPLWKSWFHSEEDLISFHYLDFSHAKTLAANYSEQLRVDAYASGSDTYVDIVALSARQTLGATSFSGTPEDPLVFLKEISSNGNCQTVDVIFPAFPFFLYTNPRWAAYLLEPLLEHQLKGLYPNKYSMHDLGSHFPNLTGHADGLDEYMPVEECGDMLIMGLALVNSMKYKSDEAAQSIWSTVGRKDNINDGSDHCFTLMNLGTQDGIDYIDSSWGGGEKGVKQATKWLERSYPLWKQWTSYLVEFSSEPENQRKSFLAPSDHAQLITANSLHRRLRRLAASPDQSRPKRYHWHQSLQRARVPPRPHRRRTKTPEDIRQISRALARARHLGRRLARKAGVRLVRQLDHTLLALLRCAPLLPPLPHQQRFFGNPIPIHSCIAQRPKATAL
jgi:hypothetical protein